MSDSDRESLVDKPHFGELEVDEENPHPLTHSGSSNSNTANAIVHAAFDHDDDDISLDPDYKPPGSTPSKTTTEQSGGGTKLGFLGINLNPLNLNLNPLGLNLNTLNPLNIHATSLQALNPLNPVHRERAQHFFQGVQTGAQDINTKMLKALNKMRSQEYKMKMNKVLTTIKNTKEYQSSSNTDYDVVFESVDMYTDMQMDVLLEKEAVEGGVIGKLRHWTRKERISTLLFIPLLGVLIGCMGLVCDITLKYMEMGKQKLINSTDIYVVNFFLYVAYATVLASVSAACISYISPYAVGSGIPEIKSILSGIDLSRVLSRRTLVSKVVGMVAATAAGLTIGRTGPFMHASAIIAHQLMQLKIFTNIRKNQFARHQMLISSLAAGVTANFGAPIGGLLFALEITGSNSFFGNLWKGFLCATTCAVVFELTRVFLGGVAFAAVYKFEFVLQHLGAVELISFVGVGILCGLLGAFFVLLFDKIVRFRLRYKILRTSRIPLVAVVAALSAMCSFAIGSFGHLPLSKAMVALLNNKDIHFDLLKSQNSNLGLYIAVKFFLTIFNVVLPIPGGAITPFLVLGAALGRLFGDLLDADMSTGIIPAGYAVIGAAGVVSGTTRTIAPSVFVLELTGQLSLLIPVLICSITASAVGNLFNKPLFDTALKIQNLPFLSNFRSEKVYRMNARDVMNADLHFLSMESPLGFVSKYVERYDERFVPLVQSKSNMILEGIAERKSLMFVVQEFITEWKAKNAPPRLEQGAILSSSSSKGVDLQLATPPTNYESDSEIHEEELKDISEEDRGWEEMVLADVLNESEHAVLIDFSPSQIPESTPLNKVFHLFIMLGLGFTFVTRYGALVGVITKKELIKREL